MATLYRTYQRPQHGGGPMRDINTAVTYAVPSHNNIPVSVYGCGPCVASCASVNIRLQRTVTSVVRETIGTRLNKEICDTRVGPGRVDETFTNVRKSGASMFVVWGLDGEDSVSAPFYHDN